MMSIDNRAAAILALLPLACVHAGERQLIGDPDFRLGCRVLSPVGGKVVVVDTVTFPGAAREPVWSLAQWHSRFSVEGVPLEIPEPGVYRLANAAKEVIWAPADHPRGQLIMELNASLEYAGRARKRGEQWPHLLLSQRFPDPPRISDLSAARFHIETRLLHVELHRTEDYSPRHHAAQFQVFFNIQNLTRESDGYGDFLYFGIPLYDSRFRIPRGFTAPDQVGTFIYTPPGDAYTAESTHDQNWVEVDKDILPLIREALDKAWEKNFLQGSRNVSDYRIAAMNIGWEVPGILDVAVQTRNLRLTVHRHNAP